MLIDIGAGFQLTEFRPTDAGALIECLSVKDIYDTTLRIPWPYGISEAEGWLRIANELDPTIHAQVNWAIRNSSGVLIGGIGLTVDSISVHRAEIGYWLAKPFWGRGIMTQIVDAICLHAFQVLNFDKITASIFAHNMASARVLLKCGFQQEGYLHRHYRKEGKFIDARTFGRLRPADEPKSTR